MADDNEAERVAKKVYGKAPALYAEMRSESKVQNNLYYEVLYGPPAPPQPARLSKSAQPPPSGPDVVFVGVQPGGGEGERFKMPEGDRPWPKKLVYAEVPAPFPLAQRLQLAFQADPALLSESTGLNAVFFRAPSWRAWCKMVPERQTRGKIEQSCATLAKELVSAIRPRLVVAIGFSALRLLGSRGEPRPSPRGGRVLLREGEVAGIPALAMYHPTPPARAPSNAELTWIGSEILRYLGRPSCSGHNA